MCRVRKYRRFASVGAVVMARFSSIIDVGPAAKSDHCYPSLVGHAGHHRCLSWDVQKSPMKNTTPFLSIFVYRCLLVVIYQSVPCLLQFAS